MLLIGIDFIDLCSHIFGQAAAPRAACEAIFSEIELVSLRSAAAVFAHPHCLPPCLRVFVAA